MAVITLDHVTKQFGTQKVLSGVSLELHPSERAGLIGANGVGKTTLLRIISGEIQPDTGSAFLSRNCAVAVLSQEPNLNPDHSLHDEVLSVFEGLAQMERRMHAISQEMADAPSGADLDRLMEQYERVNASFIAAGGHKYETRLKEILGGLGFSPDDYDRPVRQMSGGQKTRTALAKLLLAESRFLLLDEPTNHLDIDAVRWLEKFLANYDGGALIVSHDRYLLDSVCNRIIELDRGGVSSYPGNYSNFAQTKELRLLTQSRDLAKDQAFIKKERDFIARHLAGQRTKEAQGRRKRLERMLADGEFVTEAHHTNRKAGMSFDKSANAGTGTVLRIEALAKGFDGKALFSDLSVQVQSAQRVGITGPNGTGKTTLLKIVVGLLQPDAGDVHVDTQLRTGFHEQEFVFNDLTQTPLDLVRAERPELAEQQARDFLARFLFTGDDVFKPLEVLSGGEQSRVRLACLILQSPDLLILDEPTNHLDIASREVLEEALVEFPGTIVAVSHDRYFLDRLADRLLVMRDGGCAAYDGNYSFFLQQTEKAQPDRPKKASSKGKSKPPETHKSKPSPYDSMSVSELETLVIEKETALESLQEQFGSAETYADPDALVELQEEMALLESELAEVDAAWQQRVEHQ